MQLRKIKTAVIRYAFLGSYGSVVLWLMRKFNMERKALKDFVYGGLTELMSNDRYYHYSRVGINYSHWTDDGLQALAEYTNVIGHMVIKAQEEDLDRRAKDMVMAELKK